MLNTIAPQLYEPEGTTLIKKTPKVSVIVPVYNTEMYVERAINSLMEQTLDDVQFIIIDDGSKDNSLSIIKQVIARYPERKGLINLISRENRGVAATRAQGIELALGDYLIHLDSDDWAERNWLEDLYTIATNENADVVVCDYVEVYENQLVHKTQAVANNSVDCVKNLLLGKIANSNWNKLVARSLFSEHDINFHSGYDMGEDFLVTFLVFMKAKNIRYTGTVLYFYNQINEAALTKHYSSKSLSDLVLITSLTSDYLFQSGLSKLVEREFNLFKLTVVSLIIVHSSYDIDKIRYAFGLYPSANKMIFLSKMKTLKLIYMLKKMRLLFLLRYIVSIREWQKRLT